MLTVAYYRITEIYKDLCTVFAVLVWFCPLCGVTVQVSAFYSQIMYSVTDPVWPHGHNINKCAKFIDACCSHSWVMLQTHEHTHAHVHIWVHMHAHAWTCTHRPILTCMSYICFLFLLIFSVASSFPIQCSQNISIFDTELCNQFCYIFRYLNTDTLVWYVSAIHSIL